MRMVFPSPVRTQDISVLTRDRWGNPLAYVTRIFGIEFSALTGNYTGMSQFDPTFDPGSGDQVYRPALPSYPSGPLTPGLPPPPYSGPPVHAGESESEVS